MKRESMKELEQRSKLWANVSWAAFAAIVICALIVFSTYGVVDQGYGQKELNPAVAIACLSQVFVGLLIAAHFTLMHSMHRLQIQTLSALESPGPVQKPRNVGDEYLEDEVAAEVIEGKGRVIAYVNESSPMASKLAKGDRLISINGAEVLSPRQAAQLLDDGDNRAVIVSGGKPSQIIFDAHVGASLGIKFQ